MLRTSAVLLALLAALYLAGCSGLSPQDDMVDPPASGDCTAIRSYTPLSGGLGPVGTDSTLDLASWNLEFFPVRLPGDFDCPHPNDPARITKLAELITALNLDVIAVQEVSEPNGFAELMAMLPGYDGALIPEYHGCNYQRTGVIYRTDIVTLHSFRTLNELSEFTREPFMADLTVAQSGKSYRFRLISVHLKAGGEEDAPRRRTETNQLHAYLDARAAAEPGVDYIVAGDWNDVLTDPATNSSFPAFLADSESYTFVTDTLKSQPVMASLGSRLIDLILINESACADFSRARVSTLRLDQMVPGYSSLISDHRPVMVSTPVFK